MLNWLFRGGLRQIGQTAQQIGGVFKPNAEAHARRAHDYQSAALDQYASEFQHRVDRTWFDSLVDGLNRLPRPIMAFGTIGLFAYAMLDPLGFTARMVGLDAVPDELWWLLGAIVGFYFGARELQKFRTEKTTNRIAQAERIANTQDAILRIKTALSPQEAADDTNQTALDIAGDMTVTDNPAIKDWQKNQK